MARLLRQRQGKDVIENEIKLEVSSGEDFRRILEFFSACATEESRDVLVNYYLDTENLALAKQLIMIRVRSAKKNFLTFKNGTQIEDGYFRSTEIEVELDALQLDEALANPCVLFEWNVEPIQELERQIGRVELELIGKLENERTRLRVDDHLVELDRMRFPDLSEEYEIELESERPEEAREWCLTRLSKLGVEVSPSTRTKFHRLLGKMGKAD